MDKKLICCLILLLSAAFLACTTQARIQKRERPKLPVPAIIHQSGGTVIQPYVRPYSPVVEQAPVLHVALDRRHKVFKLHRRLRKEGIQFVRVGEDLTLVLQSEDFFYERSPRLFDSKTVKHRLWLIAQYLNCFDKIDVNVSAYTCNQGPMKRNLALSQHRADEVADMLEHYKLDSRILVAKGYGPSFPIASNKTKYGQRMNERVEISIRELAPESLIRETAW